MSSAHAHEPDHRHVHGHDDHGHHVEGDIPHASMREYMTGFVLSVILTAIPFMVVMGDVFSSKVFATGVVLVFAAVQMLVHMVYFLHLNTRSQSGWNMLALIFTLVLVVITLSGSLWVMFNMNANMMPPATHGLGNLR